MNELFESVKADLLDRRLRPVLALVAVALVAAIAYAVFGGSSSTTPPASSAPPATSAVAAGIAVSQASSEAQAPVAETTSGTAQQTGGATRNPFSAVPGAKATSSAASSGSASEGSSKTSASGGGEAESGSKPSTGESPSSGAGTAPSQTKKSAPAKKKTVYTVAVLFGVAPAGSPQPSPTLTPHEHLKREQPLPSSSQPLVVFRGVTAGGKSASFTLVGEAILRGTAACLPNASQCQAIDLKPGQVEELEYVPPEGAPVVYQLQVVSIDPSKTSASAARRIFRAQSKAGLKLLRSAGLWALPGLRYSAKSGVLVFADHPAFAARSSIAPAHAAAWGSWLRG